MRIMVVMIKCFLQPEEEYVKLLDDMGLARTESTEEFTQNKEKDLTELLDFVE